MRWWERFAELDRKFAWSFLGVLIALILGSLTIYQFLFEDRRPSVRFDILANTSVLDVREDLKELDIVYEGIDIRKSGQALRVMTVKIQNDSSNIILIGYYDPRDPLGLELTEGKIIKTPELLATSNEYLKKHLDPRLKSERVLTFSPVTFEAHDFFLIKLLILHPNDKQPIIQPMGKIAGVKHVTVGEPFRESGKESIWSLAFSGNAWIQIMRVIAYFLGAIVFILSVGAPIALISDWRERNKRKRASATFRETTEVQITEKTEFLFTKYVTQGPVYLLRVERLLLDDRLNEVCKKLEEDSAELRAHGARAKEEEELRLMPASILFGDRVVARDLLRSGCVRKEGDKYTLDNQISTVLDEFTSYLRKHGHITAQDRFRHQSLEMLY